MCCVWDPSQHALQPPSLSASSTPSAILRCPRCRLPGSSLSKILLGLHFYGNEYSFVGKKLVGHEAVVGPAFIQRLQKQQAKSGAQGGSRLESWLPSFGFAGEG